MEVKSGVDTLNELEAAFNGIAGAPDPASMKPSVQKAASLLQETQPRLTVGLLGIVTVEISNRFGELVDVFQQGLAALDGPKADGAATDLRALANQALQQLRQ